MKKQTTKRRAAAKKPLREKSNNGNSVKNRKTQSRKKQGSSVRNQTAQNGKGAKRTRRKKKSSGLKERNAHYLKQGVQQAVYVVGIFLTLFTLSLAFLLYQWKDYKIVEFGKEIQQYRSDILRLKSEVSRNQAKINSDLIKYHRIAQISGEKLGLKPSVQEPIVLKIDKNALEYYVGKDRNAEE